jgi:hypothetical protein
MLFKQFYRSVRPHYEDKKGACDDQAPLEGRIDNISLFSLVSVKPNSHGRTER